MGEGYGSQKGRKDGPFLPLPHHDTVPSSSDDREENPHLCQIPFTRDLPSLDENRERHNVFPLLTTRRATWRKLLHACRGPPRSKERVGVGHDKPQNSGCIILGESKCCHAPAKAHFGPRLDQGIKKKKKKTEQGTLRQTCLNRRNNVRYKGLKKKKSQLYHSRRLPERRCKRTDCPVFFTPVEGSVPQIFAG